MFNVSYIFVFFCKSGNKLLSIEVVHPRTHDLILSSKYFGEIGSINSV